MSTNVREDQAAAAASRRQLIGNNLFENLGDPIKKILLQVTNEGRDVDDATLQLLQHVTVKQLAKVFDMLDQGEDVMTILAWLKWRARSKANQSSCDRKEERKSLIATGAQRDPVAFYKAIEEANSLRAAEHEEMEAERAQLRLAKAKEREKARETQVRQLEEAQQAVENEGGWWKATDHLPEKDKNAINDAFDKFATRTSDFDNTDKDQDGEWWKRDPIRRDWERYKGQGKKWTAVIEGSKNKATDSELAIREAFYQDADWWKADRYKRDWEATKDSEWWKEGPYIREWQQHKHAGSRWKAVDECNADLESEGITNPASAEEQTRREEWYKANGPCGVVKKWNAATEGDAEKCTVPEKLAREEFYRNGDWWKKDDARQDFKDKGLDCDAMKFAAQPKDQEWWKQEPYREDFFKNGDKGKKWLAVTEEVGIDAHGDVKPTPSIERQKRADWYRANWWKQPEIKDDWKKNGESGKAWKASGKTGHHSSQPVGPAEQRARENWYRNNSDGEWWKQPQYIEDYFQKGNEGRHWSGKTEDDGAAGNAHQHPCDGPEKMKRKEWYTDNWWRQPKYINDYHKKGALGDIWRGKSDTPNTDKEWWKQGTFIDNWRKTNKQKTAPEGVEWWKQPQYVEDFHRHGPKGTKWCAKDQTNGEEGAGDRHPTTPDQMKVREEWYRHNWWTSTTHALDWAALGPRGKTWKLMNAPEDGSTTGSEAPEGVRAQRDDWYRPIGDMWRACGEGQALAKNAASNPCTLTEAIRRDEWYRQNWWKAPEFVDDWKKNGANGKKWAAGNEDAGSKGKADEDPASSKEQQLRDDWYRLAGDVSKQDEEHPGPQLAKREDWYRKQLSDDDKARRMDWLRERCDNEKCILADELGDALAAINEGQTPSEEQVQAVRDQIEWNRLREKDDFGPEGARGRKRGVADDDSEPEETICQSEFLKAATNFFIPPDADEFEMQAEDEKAIQERDDMAREEEEAAYLAMEAEGEGNPEDDPMARAGDEVSHSAKGAEEAEEGSVCGIGCDVYSDEFINEDDASDDVDWTNCDDDVYTECSRGSDEEHSDEEEEEEEEEDEEVTWGDYEEEESCTSGESDNVHRDDDEMETALNAPLPSSDDEWTVDEESEELPSEGCGCGVDCGVDCEIDCKIESEVESEGWDPEAEPWMLPLPEVTNNIYLKSYFPVLKWNPNKAFGPADRRIWVVDHFAKSFYCLDPKGNIRRQHDANKLLQLEKNVMDPRRARLMFFDAAKSYEIVFSSNDERERFYETGSSIRPAIRVYAPSLTKPDTAVDGGSTTTIDGTRHNAVVQKVPNPLKKTGELLDRELQGRCQINASKVQDEPVSVWCGTFNMCGSPPPRDSSSLESWMPKGKYDLYAVATQECSYQKEEGEWFAFVQDYLGKDYLTLASMQMWDITLVVLCRKKCLLKITNVEGSTKATLHKEKCGMKGAAGICLRFHNTSMAFISCHLAARLERTKMRNINVQEICNQISLANKDCDLSSQFHHVFWMGDMNYRVEMENAEAQPLLDSKKYIELLNQDQLLNEIEEGNILHGFKEAPITFPPTYRYKKGSSDYMNDRGRAPSYTDRILVKSMSNTTIKCTGYKAADVHTSEHMPVYATYVVRCVRPHMNCFHRDQEPRPQFEFSEISFEEQNHLMFRKPMLMVYTPFSEHAHKGKSSKTSTMKPTFTGEQLPAPIKCSVQMSEYLERHALIIIFRDLAEPREDKMFRGAAVMELQGRMQYDEEQEVLLDVVCLSRKIGVIKCKFKVTNYGYTPPPGGAPGRVPKEALMDEE